MDVWISNWGLWKMRTGILTSSGIFILATLHHTSFQFSLKKEMLQLLCCDCLLWKPSSLATIPKGLLLLVVVAREHKQKKSSCWTSSFCVSPPPKRSKPFFLDSKSLPMFSRHNLNRPCPTPRNRPTTFTSSYIPDQTELILTWLLAALLERWWLKLGVL